MRNLWAIVAVVTSVWAAYHLTDYTSKSNPSPIFRSPAPVAERQTRPERIVYSAFDATTDQPMILDIFVMDADGTNQTNLTKSRAGEADPKWSPDGSLIAYSVYMSVKPGTEGIYVMKATALQADE